MPWRHSGKVELVTSGVSLHPNLHENLELRVADLDYLAVDPVQQRRGIGKFLLDWGVTRAMDKGRDCYLIATPVGRPLYLSAGFQDIRTVQIFNTTHYSMILRCA